MNRFTILGPNLFALYYVISSIWMNSMVQQNEEQNKA